MRNHGGTFMQVQQTRRRSWSSLFPSEFHHRRGIRWNLHSRSWCEARFFISHVNAAFKAAQIAVFGRFINSKFHSLHDTTANERPGPTGLLLPATLSRTANKYCIGPCRHLYHQTWSILLPQKALISFIKIASCEPHQAVFVPLYLVSWTPQLQRVCGVFNDEMTALPLGRRVDTHLQTCFVS